MVCVLGGRGTASWLQSQPGSRRAGPSLSASVLRFTVPHSQDLVMRLTENRTYTPMLSRVCGGRKLTQTLTLEHYCESENRVRFFATPWIIQSMEFSRPEY